MGIVAGTTIGKFYHLELQNTQKLKMTRNFQDAKLDEIQPPPKPEMIIDELELERIKMWKKSKEKLVFNKTTEVPAKEKIKTPFSFKRPPEIKKESEMKSRLSMESKKIFDLEKPKSPSPVINLFMEKIDTDRGSSSEDRDVLAPLQAVQSPSHKLENVESKLVSDLTPAGKHKRRSILVHSSPLPTIVSGSKDLTKLRDYEIFTIEFPRNNNKSKAVIIPTSIDLNLNIGSKIFDIFKIDLKNVKFFLNIITCNFPLEYPIKTRIQLIIKSILKITCTLGCAIIDQGLSIPVLEEIGKVQEKSNKKIKHIGICNENICNYPCKYGYNERNDLLKLECYHSHFILIDTIDRNKELDIYSNILNDILMQSKIISIFINGNEHMSLDTVFRTATLKIPILVIEGT